MSKLHGAADLLPLSPVLCEQLCLKMGVMPVCGIFLIFTVQIAYSELSFSLSVCLSELFDGTSDEATLNIPCKDLCIILFKFYSGINPVCPFEACLYSL